MLHDHVTSITAIMFLLQKIKPVKKQLLVLHERSDAKDQYI